MPKLSDILGSNLTPINQKGKTWFKVEVELHGKLAVVTIVPPLFDNTIFWHNNKRYRISFNLLKQNKTYYVPANNYAEAQIIASQKVQQIAPYNEWKDFSQNKIFKRENYVMKRIVNTNQEIIQLGNQTTVNNTGQTIPVIQNANLVVGSFYQGYIQNGNLVYYI